MRELKFRAWHTVAKYMFKPTDLEAYSMALLRVPYEGNFELMQYTGLHDKQGKEIYESDRVTDGINPPFTVTWDYLLLARLAEIEVEVIGNIYEP